MHRTLLQWRDRIADISNPMTDVDLAQMLEDTGLAFDLNCIYLAEVRAVVLDPVAALNAGTDLRDLLRRVLIVYPAVLGISPAKFLWDLEGEDSPGFAELRTLFQLTIGIAPDVVPTFPEHLAHDHHHD